MRVRPPLPERAFLVDQGLLMLRQVETAYGCRYWDNQLIYSSMLWQYGHVRREHRRFPLAGN